MVNVKEKLEQGWVHFRTIVEMLGAPKDYIESTLKAYIEKIKNDKNYEVLNEKIEPAVPQEKLFSTFVELEMLAKDIPHIAWFCFDYMPSSIEILAPEKFNYLANDMSDFLNDLQAKLHNLDMFVKTLRAENSIIKKNAGALLRNLIIARLAQEPLDLETLSKRVGIAPKQLEPFLKKMEEDSFIKKEGELYKLVKK